MPRVIFTQQLARFTELPEVDVDAATLGQALDAAFALNPRLRSYVLDEQSQLRPNVAVFIEGRRLRDHCDLAFRLESCHTVYVLQSLSGG